jgi:hypothetical protein
MAVMKKGNRGNDKEREKTLYAHNCNETQALGEEEQMRVDIEFEFQPWT